MTDQRRCACAPPRKVCCWCYSRLSPAEQTRWLVRLGISHAGHAHDDQRGKVFRHAS